MFKDIIHNCRALGPKFIVCGDDDGERIASILQQESIDSKRALVYEEDVISDFDDESEYLMISQETVDKAYLFEGEGYRETICYGGLVKVNGVWYECDFISEGAAYPTKLSDSQVEKLIKQL